MQQNNKQAYDRGTNIFSPDGRLYQVEYAREAVKRGNASVAVRTPEGIAFTVERNVRSDLLEESSIEKLYQLDEHIGAATAGHVADARALIDVIRQQAQMNRLRYGKPITVEQLTKAMTDHVQEFTQVGGTRPFGVAILLGGIDPDGTPRLFEADPSGTPYEWQASAVGRHSDEIRNYLEEEYEEEMTLEEGTNLAIRALSREQEIESDGLAVSVIDAEDTAYTVLDRETVEDRLAELDLLAEGDNE